MTVYKPPIALVTRFNRGIKARELSAPFGSAEPGCIGRASGGSD
jgi:hypothetical protein